MSEQIADPLASPHAPGEDESVSQLLARVAADARAYASAELDRQKLRAGLIGAGVRDAAIFAVIAAMLIFAGLVALMVGLTLALAALIGPLWAALAIFGGALALSLILLLFAKARVGRMTKAIKP